MFGRPRAAVRVVLERVEVARLGAEVERDPRHLAGGIRMVGGELAARLRLRVAAAAGAENDRGGLDLVLAAQGAPAALERLEALERRVLEARAGAGLPGLAQRLRDRVAGAVADLEQALLRRAAAAGEPVAAVLARELDPELLEPVDRARRLAGQDLDQPPVGGLVRGAPDVLGVLLGRVPRGRRRPGSRPAPSTSCSPAASPSSPRRRGRRRARPRRRRQGRRPRCRSRARRRGPSRSRRQHYQTRLIPNISSCLSEDAAEQLLDLGRRGRSAGCACCPSGPPPSRPLRAARPRGRRSRAAARTRRGARAPRPAATGSPPIASPKRATASGTTRAL